MRPMSKLEVSSEAFCRVALPEVSRTFALNIPVLPPPLDLAVTVAYLLCRIADTIEDEAVGQVAERRVVLAELSRLSTFPKDWAEAAQVFGETASKMLRKEAPPAEVRLVAGTQQVFEVLEPMSHAVRAAVARCVSTMTAGMGEFVTRGTRGLANVQATLDYCYYVAGCVGEMLTALFLDHGPLVAEKRNELEPRAVAFGRALQLTNILKDIREDLDRGACWLPLDRLKAHGLSVDTLAQPEKRAQAVALLDELIGVAHREVAEAFDYILAVPREEKGIRLFCLWPLFMAVLTLRKLRGNAAVFDPAPVKITRDAVRNVVALTRATVGRDWALRLLFVSLTASLPPPAPRVSAR
ncbi:MAG: phytoene/squalene synthase family protein [Myxococcaceae bacterium]